MRFISICFQVISTFTGEKMVRENELPPGLAEELKKSGQRAEDFTSLVAPYKPGDENIVLEGEDARRFQEMLAHNEKCLGADANPPCEPCARRHETLFRAHDTFGKPGEKTKGDFKCGHCGTRRSSKARLKWHKKIRYEEAMNDTED